MSPIVKSAYSAGCPPSPLRRLVADHKNTPASELPCGPSLRGRPDEYRVIYRAVFGNRPARTPRIRYVKMNSIMAQIKELANSSDTFGRAEIQDTLRELQYSLETPFETVMRMSLDVSHCLFG